MGALRAGLAGGADALADAYAAVRATSIDYAVLEPASLAGRVAMVRADVGWSDLGSWAALRDALVARATADRRAGRGRRVRGHAATSARTGRSCLPASGSS